MSGRAVIFHVDLDAFYASVEQRDNPTLRGRPVIVGALPGRRGVVSACSYEARRFGIHSAMPISEAYRRCPRGAFLPVRMSRYMEVSRGIMTALHQYTPDMQQISVDEAFLDLTGTERLFGPPLEVGRRMKAEIWGSERLTISVGIAPNRYLAKLASEADKPDGLCMVSPGEEERFLDRLELGNLWGLGKKTLARLHQLGIATVPQLRGYGREDLTSLLGDGAARFLHGAVRGEDPGIHSPRTRSHSMSHETTFEEDTTDRASLELALLELAQQLVGRLLDSDWRGRTLFLKLRTHDFATTTAQATLPRPPATTEEIYEGALDLLDKRWDGATAVRLIGVGVAGVEESEPEQGELFAEKNEKRRKVEEAVHRLKARKVEVTRASLLGRRPRRGGPEGR